MWDEKCPAVYILASKRHGTLYVGVTSDLHGRMQEHKQGVYDGFAKKYGVNILVYYEMLDDMDSAIRREKQLKHWNRAWKVRAIETMNPEWGELYDERENDLRFGPADIAREGGGTEIH
jgi:putative endonuclease